MVLTEDGQQRSPLEVGEDQSRALGTLVALQLPLLLFLALAG